MDWKSIKRVSAATAAAAILCPATLFAQNEFVGDPQPAAAANQTIELKPPSGSQSPSGAYPAPPKVGFDDITVPQVLQSPAKTADPAKTGNRILQPLPQQGLPVKSKVPAQPASTFKSAIKKPIAAAARMTTSKAAAFIDTEIESPSFVNVNKQAPITIKVNNNGQTAVTSGTFVATLPAHAKLISTNPAPARIDGQRLEFSLDGLAAQDSRQIVLNVQPTQRQPIEIATSIRTENQHRVQVGVREPQLSLELKGPQQTNVGETISHELIVSNVGDGIATDVQVFTQFPEQLVKLNSSLKGPIKSIAPGQSVKVTYQSQAISAGPIEVKTSAHSDDGVEPKLTSIGMTVFQPKLQISAIGPKANFVNRNGIYTLNLENNGKVDITNVQVALAVPAGMKITTISREAQVDAKKGVLRWTFDRIPVGSTEQIQMMSIVTREGPQVCNFVIDSQETSEKQIQLTTQVTTRADLAIQIKNQSGPVQVGGKAIFEVAVANRGSRQAADILVGVELPDSLQAIPVDGQKYVIDGNTILYTESEIAPGKRSTFQFTVIGKASGEHVVRSTTRIQGSERRTMAEDTVFVYEVDEARVSESLTPTVPKR